jgi:16S rRNA U1498 N3-methylase RsmE
MDRLPTADEAKGWSEKERAEAIEAAEGYSRWQPTEADGKLNRGSRFTLEACRHCRRARKRDVDARRRFQEKARLHPERR